MRECDFVFYWGHGWSTARDGAVLDGTGPEGIPIEDLGDLGGKRLYLDACKVGFHLDDAAHPAAHIVAPTRAVSYRVSLTMGCTFMEALFGEGLTFAGAYRRARDRMRSRATYRLVGGAPSAPVAVPRLVSADVSSLFKRIAGAARIRV